MLDGKALGEQLAAITREYHAKAIAGLRALPQVSLAESAGSLRRSRETVGDLDFLVASSEPRKIGLVSSIYQSQTTFQT